MPIENQIFPELELRFAGIPVAKQSTRQGAGRQIAAAFQAAAVDDRHQADQGREDLGLKQIVVAGGVACNSALRPN